MPKLGKIYQIIDQDGKPLGYEGPLEVSQAYAYKVRDFHVEKNLTWKHPSTGRFYRAIPFPMTKLYKLFYA